MDIIITIILIVLILFSIDSVRRRYLFYGEYCSMSKIMLKDIIASIKVIENGSVLGRVEIAKGNQQALWIEKRQNEFEWWFVLTIVTEEKDNILQILEEYVNHNKREIRETKIFAMKAFEVNLGADSKIVSNILIRYFINCKNNELDTYLRYTFQNVYTNKTIKDYLKEF